MNWKKRNPKRNIAFLSKKKSISDNIWTQCLHCKYILYRKKLRENLEVCPKCDFHMKITARSRILAFLDKDNLSEIGKNLEPKDILNFKDLKKYKDRLYLAQQKTEEKDAIIVMQGKLCNIPVVVASFEFDFIGGSMSAMVGKRFVLAVEKSLESFCPLICFSSSGGARIQESLISLMQMAKTSAALKKLKKKNIPYISVLTHPTMGGVSASLAMLGDLNIAEPRALIGFAGPRVIEQTVRKKLPIEFQKSEFLLERGMIDMIIRRTEMKIRIARLLAKLIHLPQP